MDSFSIYYALSQISGFPWSNPLIIAEILTVDHPGSCGMNGPLVLSIICGGNIDVNK